jgi:hypothetical protein
MVCEMHVVERGGESHGQRTYKVAALAG